jgi:hypothetical protein
MRFEMPVFTVHAPRATSDRSAADPDRFVFVRDGFHFWAFVLAPLWMLRYRLWLALVIYFAVTAAIDLVLYSVGVRGNAMFVAAFVLALLVGFEASTLRRWKLARRGWTNLGVVVGRDREDAERRFFDTWTRSQATHRPAPPPAASTFRMPQAVTDIVGLFPEPGARR